MWLWHLHSNTNAHPHSSIFWSVRVIDPPPTLLPETLNTCQSLPSAERLSIFSYPGCNSTHARYGQTRSQIKKTFNHQFTKCLTKYQKLIKEDLVRKDIRNSFWTNAVSVHRHALRFTASGILKTQAPYLFLNHRLKGYCQEWQK